MSASSSLRPTDLSDSQTSPSTSPTPPTIDSTRTFFTESSVKETVLLLSSIATTGILSRIDLKAKGITTLNSNDLISDHTPDPDYVCLNVMCKSDGMRMNKKLAGDRDWLDPCVRHAVFNPASGVISVGIERYEDLLDPMQFYGLNKTNHQLFKQRVEFRAHGIALFLLNPQKITLQKEIESDEVISIGGEYASYSIEPEAIEMVFVPDEILELTKKIFSSLLVVGVKSIQKDLLCVAVPCGLSSQHFFRDKPEELTNRCRLEDILIPDFASAIRQIAEVRFGDLSDFSNSDSLSPLFFHAVRLPIQQCLAVEKMRID